MKATGLFPKLSIDCRVAATLPTLRPVPTHMPLRRPAAAPLQQCADAAPPQASVSAGAWSGAPVQKGAPDNAPRVLHIDNDVASALALAVLLTPEARVIHVPTLAAARALLQQQIFSVVVMDPNLPDGDGAELLPALAAMPLVVYSATEPQWCARAGVYLPKPWTSQRRLWGAISTLLGIPALPSTGA